MTASLTCPKCGGRMKTYGRTGVTIDQCTECRGIYLDRGELPSSSTPRPGTSEPQKLIRMSLRRSRCRPADRSAPDLTHPRQPATPADDTPMRSIYLKLPVKNVDESREFFTKLGFAYYPRSPTSNAPA